jgi:hypothetical protein
LERKSNRGSADVVHNPASLRNGRRQRVEAGQHHIGGMPCGGGAGLDRGGKIRFPQGRHVVDAVAKHCNRMALRF